MASSETKGPTLPKEVLESKEFKELLPLLERGLEAVGKTCESAGVVPGAGAFEENVTAAERPGGEARGFGTVSNRAAKGDVRVVDESVPMAPELDPVRLLGEWLMRNNPRVGAASGAGS